jgi:hypothetical protein
MLQGIKGKGKSVPVPKHHTLYVVSSTLWHISGHYVSLLGQAEEKTNTLPTFNPG